MALENSERLLIKAWRDTLRKGDQVEVRDRKSPRPRLGKILNTTARGCGVLYESNHDGFAYWNDIYPRADRLEELLKHFDKTVRKATRGGATIADIVKIKGGVSLKVVPPPKAEPEEPKELRPLTALPSMVRMTPSDQVPPGAHSHGHILGSTTPEPAPEAPPPPPKQMQPAKVIVVKQPKAEPPPAPLPLPELPKVPDLLGGRSGFSPPPEETKPAGRTFKRGDGRAAHALTDIAIALRTERIRRGETQREASVTLRISAPVLSRLELGVDHPTDDQLLCYVDHYKMDLNALLRARDGQEDNAPEEPPAKVEHVAKIEHVAPLALVLPEPEPPNERLDWFMDMLDFTERLKLAIPFPADVEKRRAWYKAALMMFEVHNGS